MSSLYILIPVTVLLLLGAILVFLWAVNNDQFDDLDQHASRILFDDDEQPTIEAMNKPQEDDAKEHD
jgi:cbb3-type cytochrome oxidase maturation protein